MNLKIPWANVDFDDNPISKYMTEDEKILFDGGTLYATNQRLIYHNIDSLGEENFWDMDYKHISSIEFNSKGNLVFLILGTISIILTLLSNISRTYFIKIDLATGITISAIFFALWLLFKQNSLKINAAGIKKGILNVDRASAQQIIKLIRSKNPK